MKTSSALRIEGPRPNRHTSKLIRSESPVMSFCRRRQELTLVPQASEMNVAAMTETTRGNRCVRSVMMCGPKRQVSRRHRSSMVNGYEQMQVVVLLLPLEMEAACKKLRYDWLGTEPLMA